MIKTVLPWNITAFYPLPTRVALSDLRFLLPTLGTLSVTVGVFVVRRRSPALAAVWASYLAILAPNLGLVRIGHQIAADRYSYIAMMGMVVLVAAGICEMWKAVKRRRAAAWG
jgi:hypothetical protein